MEIIYDLYLQKSEEKTIADDELIIKDTNSNTLKDEKIKGSSQVVKVVTEVRNIRLIQGDHNIDCKIDGIGAMKLKLEFVKKA